MTTIRLHRTQSRVFKDLFVGRSVRHGVVTASRGWGKSAVASVGAIKAAEELMHLDASVPNKNVALVAPTFTSVVDIYFNLIMHQFGLSSVALKDSRDRGRIWLPNNVTIKLVSAEAIERVRGGGVYFAVGDEIDTWTIRDPIKAWDSVIHGAGRSRWSDMMAARYGSRNAFRTLVIGSSGGVKSLYTLSEREKVDEQYRKYCFDYHDSPYLDPEEIEKARDTMDEVAFRQEYCGEFLEGGNRVYRSFSVEHNILENCPQMLKFLNTLSPEERGSVCVGIDFNVGINACVVGHIIGDTVVILDELQGTSNTEELAGVLFRKYGPCYTYPDPTGRSRRTSAPVGVTDLSILKAAGHRVFAAKASPSIKDSVNTVNGMCINAKGVTRLFVSRRAKNLVDSLLRTTWSRSTYNGLTIDKSAGIEHWSDGLRYMIDSVFGRQAASTANNFNNYSVNQYGQNFKHS